MNGPEILVPITLFLSVAAILIFRGPMGKALAEAIRRQPPWADRPPPPEVDTDRVSAELEEVRQRLAELEERQDFTERLLAQQRERTALRPGAARED